MPIDYLQRILNAKVYDVAIESPLDPAPMLSRRIGNRVMHGAYHCVREPRKRFPRLTRGNRSRQNSYAGQKHIF